MRTSLLALITGLIFGVSAAPSQAAAVPGHCWNNGYYNYTAVLDEPTTIGIDLGPDAVVDRFRLQRCKIAGGIRIDVSWANTPSEYRTLRAEWQDATYFRTEWIFCPVVKGEKAYLINWSWHTMHNFQARPGEQAAYAEWASAYTC